MPGIGKAAPVVSEVLERMEKSTRQLRGYHFKSILVAMLISCLAIAGGCFILGWSKLSRYYELKVEAALERVVSVNATNEETLTQLMKMNVPIRVVPVVDNRKQAIPRKFALVVDHAEDVGIEEMGDRKRAAIYFEQSPY
jgi:hypothetical protein